MFSFFFYIHLQSTYMLAGVQRNLCIDFKASRIMSLSAKSFCQGVNHLVFFCEVFCFCKSYKLHRMPNPWLL